MQLLVTYDWGDGEPPGYPKFSYKGKHIMFHGSKNSLRYGPTSNTLSRC